MLRLLTFFIMLMPSFQVFAISLSATNWNYPTTSFSTLTTAGEYYGSSFESETTAASLTVSGAPGTPSANNSECGGTDPAWKVSAWLSTSVSGLTVRVKRTNNGSGGTLVGGNSYLTLSTASQTFFCGNGNISNIDLQFQIDNFGVDDGHGTSTWGIRYKVETL